MPSSAATGSATSPRSTPGAPGTPTSSTAGPPRPCWPRPPWGTLPCPRALASRGSPWTSCGPSPSRRSPSRSRWRRWGARPSASWPPCTATGPSCGPRRSSCGGPRGPGPNPRPTSGPRPRPARPSSSPSSGGRRATTRPSSCGRSPARPGVGRPSGSGRAPGWPSSPARQTAPKHAPSCWPTPRAAWPRPWTPTAGPTPTPISPWSSPGGRSATGWASRPAPSPAMPARACRRRASGTPRGPSPGASRASW